MFIESVLIVVAALILDAVFGELRYGHPLVGFGRVANYIEDKLNHNSGFTGRLKGVMGVLIVTLPVIGLLIVLQQFIQSPLVDVLIVYFAIGRKSLRQHALQVFKPLEKNQLIEARKKIALIVSRDTNKMNKQQVLVACIESIIENSSDAIFATLFWFLVAGAPAALLYRLVNTLDAMWGYKNSRFLYFGWATARLDDVLNWLPARLTVFSFALVSGHRKVSSLAFEQGAKCSSKNAGPVMAAGAAALNIKLGGPASYAGKVINKPVLGCGEMANVNDIKRALVLIDKTLALWLVLLLLSLFIMEIV